MAVGFTPINHNVTCNGQTTQVTTHSQKEENALNKLTGGDDNISQTEAFNAVGGKHGTTGINEAPVDNTNNLEKFKSNNPDLPKDMQLNIFKFVVKSENNVGGAGVDTPKEAYASARSAIANVCKPPDGSSPSPGQIQALAGAIAGDTALSPDDRKALLNELLKFQLPTPTPLAVSGGTYSVGGASHGATNIREEGTSVNALATRSPATWKPTFDAITDLRNAIR